MIEPVFNIRKVFDCQDMPNNVKKSFFEIESDPYVGNDIFVEWTVQSDGWDWAGEEAAGTKMFKLVDDWLIANGAAGRTDESLYNGETVLIKHWW